MQPPLPPRWASRVTPDPATGCLLWTGGKNRGYGRASFGGRMTYIHVWVWQQVNGPVPPGLELRHTCDNPACIAIGHLMLGTHADNMADMVERGRGNNANRGVTHCKWDHEFTDDNTYIQPKTGRRQCRACNRRRDQQRRGARR